MTAPVIDRSSCAGTRHGDMTAYTRYGCRCPDARVDTRRYVKLGKAGMRAPRLVDGIGTRRRLQALAAIGWTYAEIAARIGKNTPAVQRVAQGCDPRVRTVTAEAIRRVYEQLSMTPGPSTLVRGYATRHGWPPPLAWDDDLIDDPDATPNLSSTEPVVDEVAVELVLTRRANVTLSEAERLELARRLRSRGRGATELARLLRCDGSRARRLMRESA